MVLKRKSDSNFFKSYPGKAFQIAVSVDTDDVLSYVYTESLPVQGLGYQYVGWGYFGLGQNSDCPDTCRTFADNAPPSFDWDWVTPGPGDDEEG